MSGKAPVKYYCEFCGSLVRLGDRICPHCGSFFSQVRCPVCQFQGESHLFRQGCPNCGYSGKGPAEAETPAAPARKAKTPAPRKPGLEVAYVIKDQEKPAGSPTPYWVFALLAAIFVLVAVTAALLARG